MKRVLLYGYTKAKYNKVLPAIDLKWLGPLALQYFKPDEKNKFGVALLLFTLYDKAALEKPMYYQLRFNPEDEKDVEYIQHFPLNIDNMDRGFKRSLLCGKIFDAGVNLLQTDMVFSKRSGKYQIKGSVYDPRSSTFVSQIVNCNTCTYIRISQFIYWILNRYPPYMTIFSDYNYNKLKIFKVEYVSYGGSCRIAVDKNFDMMVHYTVFANSESIEPMIFGFNLPRKRIEGKIEKSPLTEDDYVNLYSNDDTISYDRIFFVSNPTPALFILSGEKGKNYYNIFMFDMKTIEKYHLLDDEYNIYFQE